MPVRILVLGASGRLGTMLQRHWCAADLHPVWQFRAAPAASMRLGEGVVFDPLERLPGTDSVDLVLGLAGIVPGKGPVAFNTDLGLAAVRCAIALRACYVMLSSSAAVYGAPSAVLREEDRACPLSAYGQSKLDMEDRALELAARHGLPATALRIGNVAGADALLAQPGSCRILDRFDSGYGPARSYIGPHGLSTVLQALMQKACSGMRLPERLNVALRGSVAMADLCQAAGLEITWQPAPSTAVETVELDVTRLTELVAVQDADASSIVADWRADQQMRRDQG